MAQHDYNLANQSGADFRADLNNALSAIVTVNSGATAPSTTFSHQLWVDTSSNVLKIRNAANDAWVTTGVSITADNTFAGNLTGNVTGNLTGDVTGNTDTATALETARTINGASFDGTANISFDTDSVSEGSSNLYYTSARFDSAFSGKSTSDLTEGTNLYYTDARFDTRLATKDTDDLTEGTNLYYTDARSRAAISATGDISYNSTTGVISFTETTAPVTSVFGRTGVVVATSGDYTTAQVTESGNLYYTDARVQAVSINNVVEDTTPQLGGDLASNGNDILFGDNDKAIFGTGSDLQIYHDSSNGSSVITEAGGGDLLIKGANLRLQSPTGENYFVAINNSSSYVYYDGSAKLATTSTGIDVTGTVTSDGLTVGANDKIQFGTSDITGIYRTNSGSDFTMQHWGNLSMLIDSDNNDSGTRQFMIGRNSQDASTAAKIALFSEGGDISFYDDTGSTQGLFWDASAERLGLGTTSPSEALSVSGNAELGSANNLYLNNDGYDGAGTHAAIKWFSTGSAKRKAADIITAQADSFARSDLLFRTQSGTVNADPTEVMRVTHDNNVGIGTSSPSEIIHTSTSSNNVGRFESTDATAYIQINDTADSFYLATGSQIGSIGGNAGVNANNLNIDLTNGNVGIGTTSPNYLLDVEGSGSLLRVNSTSGNNIVQLSVPDTTSITGVNFGDSGSTNAGYIWYRHNGDSLAFSTAGTEAIRILANGNTGIGNTAPAKNLHITDSTSPTIRFSRDNSFYWDIGHTSSDFQFISESGGTVLHMNYDGNIGIGTTSPSAKLTVSNAGESKIDIEDTGGQKHRFFVRNSDKMFGIYDVNNTSTWFRYAGDATASNRKVALLENGGSVGIGTDLPSNKLEVNGNIAVNTSSGNNGIKIITGNTAEGFLIFGDAQDNSMGGMSYNNSTNSLSIDCNNSEALRIDSSQNLLVGKTAASSYTAGFQTGQDGFTAITRALYSPLVVNRLTNNGTIIDIRKDSTTVGSIGTRFSDMYLGTGDTNLRFNDADDRVNPADATGNARDAAVDLGGSSGRFKDLYLSGAAYTGGQLKGSAGSTTKTIINATSTTTELHAAGTTGTVFKNNGDAEKMRLDGNGNFLVNTTSQISAGKLSVSGGTAANGITATTDATAGYAAASFQRTASVGTAVQFKKGASEVGSISVTASATTYNTSSDARLKDVTGEARGLEVITKLNPVAYNWKADGKADEGLIAQEVKELVPNAVTGSEDEHYQMDYSKLVTHLVKAVQELEQQTIELKKEIANLKGE